MRPNWIKRAVWSAVSALIVVGLVWFAWPRPIAVDLATVVRGPMEVTVDDDGKTRVRHIYTVSAPIAGRVLRISRPADEPGTSRHVGDAVTADETVVALMEPTTPGFLDVRTREETEAAVAAADAAIKQAEADVERLQATLDFARIELQRAQTLARTQSVSAQTLDKAKFEVDTNEAALASAKALVEMRRSLRASLAARLIEPVEAPAPEKPACCVEIRAPASGRIIKVVQESENVVAAGTPLVEIGDPADLEVVADLLSADAVQVAVGAPVRIDGWGGPPIRGRVRRVDPSGFLKISALGIEEQRVPVTIDLVDPPAVWSRLGHDYRVVAHVGVWRSEDALTVPVGALFRKGDKWAVFVVREGRAAAAPVEIGHRNNSAVEIVSGLASGDRIVLHPSDRISDGVAVSERPSQ